jgi:hypothetical protein
MIKLFQIIVLTSYAWQLPHLVPKNYEGTDSLEILVSQLKSSTASVPFDFYTLNWCDDTNSKGFDVNNYGLNLQGDFLTQSPYLFKFNTDSNMTPCSKTLN